MGLWEDASRSIPLIVSGHLFSPRIRQICSECIKGDGDSTRGRAGTRQLTARSEDVESLCRFEPLRYTGEEITTVHS